tara:strand:- start:90 stop:788 length:699 start_codon:yes stop_codon:yes gene_type:complete
MNLKDLTAAEKVLISCYDLYKSNTTFSAEDLTVKCWENYPEDFSLRGYNQYPNSNAVLLHLMNKNGALLKNGWINKVQKKIYSITDTGIAHVTKNLIKIVKTPKKNVSRSLETNRRLYLNIKGFLSNRVVQQIINGDDYTKFKFVSACSFWKINNNMTYPDIIAKQKNVTSWLEELHLLFNENEEKTIKLDKNSTINIDSFNKIKKANVFFLKQFASDLNSFKEERSNASRN